MGSGAQFAVDMSDLVQIRPINQHEAISPDLDTRLRRKTTPIIKVVGDFCNLKCGYCFYNQKDQTTRHVMSAELLEKFVREFLALSPGEVQFIWHGGEPLLAGREFFELAVSFQQRYRAESHVIRNALQTNGTLIDDGWARFFSANKFRVGVSLDGDPASHDALRQNQAGRGSHGDVLRGIQLLRANGIDPGIIQTLTAKTLPRSEEIFSFFADSLGLKGWAINAFYPGADGQDQHGVSNEDLAAYLKDCIDRWLERGEREIKNREIDNFLAGVLGRRARLCIFNGSCATYFCLEHDGRVFPCDRLSGRPDLLLGDLQKQSLAEVLYGRPRASYTQRVETLHPDCATCEWQSACHNGCTHHRIGGIDGKYYYCSARKEIFSYLKNKVSALDRTSN